MECNRALRVAWRIMVAGGIDYAGRKVLKESTQQNKNKQREVMGTCRRVRDLMRSLMKSAGFVTYSRFPTSSSASFLALAATAFVVVDGDAEVDEDVVFSAAALTNNRS